MTESSQQDDQPRLYRRGRRHGGGHEGSGEEPHEGAPEWLISFADNVTLMMGFFVILLAMNMKAYTTGGIGGVAKNTGGSPTTTLPDAPMASPQLLDLSIAIREAFNNPVDMASTDPGDQPLIRRLFQRSGDSRSPQSGPKGHEHDVEAVRPADYQAPFGTVPFSRDSSELSERARKRVVEIAGRTRGRNLIVEVRGHVSAAEAFHRADQSMRLAFDRSLVVAGALAQNGVDWWQLRLVASGDHERVAAFPAGPDEDAVNSRVEVVVTDQVVPEAVPTQPDEAQNSARWP